MPQTLHLWLFLLIANTSWGQVKFINKANLTGISHEYPKHLGGGGVSFVDFDRDGWDDLTLGTGADESIHFYQNVGGSFQKISLIETAALIKSVLWVDYNNDGHKDLYVVAYDDHNRLYKNTGNLNLIDVTESAGLPLANKRCFGASFADVNRDGWLDLYYAERRAPGETVSNQMRLFINNTDGSFSDQSVYYAAADMGKTPFCATFLDCNNDKWPDVYVANDKMTINTLLKNTGNGFEDVSVSSGTNFAMNAMCVAISDFDKNGYTDIYVTNTEEGSALLSNTDGDNFTQTATDYQVSFAGGIGWGANFFDADNDGWEDLYVSGMLEGIDVLSSTFYQNVQGQLFEQTAEGFTGDTVVSFNNAIGDFDNDGYPDICVINWTPAKAQLWSNISNDQNNWVKVDLEGLYSNRDGIGSSVCVYTPDGEFSCIYSTCGIGFLAQNSEQLLFGLGVNESIDSIVVQWPTGHIDVLSNPAINIRHDILEGSTTAGVVEIDDDISIITSLPYSSNQNREINIFPNPVTNHLSFKNLSASNFFPTNDYEIYSSAGMLVKNGTLDQSTLDISALIPGLYFIRLINTKEDWVGKFVKQ